MGNGTIRWALAASLASTLLVGCYDGLDGRRASTPQRNASAEECDSDEDCDWVAIPERTGKAHHPSASVQSLQSKVAAARPGDHIYVPGGIYRSAKLRFRGGKTGKDPIVLIPKDPDDPPVFVGRNEVSGDNFILAGAQFDASGTGRGGRMLKVTKSRGATLAYLDFDKTDNIAVELSHGVRQLKIHRVLFHGSGKKSNTVGSSAIKAGVKTTAGDQRNNRIERSRFEDIKDNRETISGKEGGLDLYRLTFDNTHDVVARHSSRMRIEECVGMRRITVNGPDHEIINSRPKDAVEVWSGSHDGSKSYNAFPRGEAAVYLSGHDVRIEHAGRVKIGDQSFKGAGHVAKGTELADVGSISTSNGAKFRKVSATTPRRTPPVMKRRDVGLQAYERVAP